MVTQRPGPAAADAENVLGDDPRPVFFAVDRPDTLGLDRPVPGDGETVRVFRAGRIDVDELGGEVRVRRG